MNIPLKPSDRLRPGQLVRVTHQVFIEVARDATVKDIEDLVQKLKAAWVEDQERILLERNLAKIIRPSPRIGS